MSTVNADPVTGTARVKRGMAEMLKGGVIMDVVTPPLSISAIPRLTLAVPVTGSALTVDTRNLA